MTIWQMTCIYAADLAKLCIVAWPTQEWLKCFIWLIASLVICQFMMAFNQEFGRFWYTILARPPGYKINLHKQKISTYICLINDIRHKQSIYIPIFYTHVNVAEPTDGMSFHMFVKNSTFTFFLEVHAHLLFLVESSCIYNVCLC